MAGLNGFAPIRRGLLQHLPKMSGEQVKCYIALCLMATPSTGEVRITMRDLGDVLGTGHNRAAERVSALESMKYVVVDRSVNQYQMTAIRITKWHKGAGYDTSPATYPANGQQTDSKRTANGQQTDSTGYLTSGNDTPNSQESQDSHKSQESQNEKPPAALANHPQCMDTELDIRNAGADGKASGWAHIIAELQHVRTERWMMTATNRGKIGAALSEGCPNGCVRDPRDCVLFAIERVRRIKSDATLTEALRNDEREERC